MRDFPQLRFALPLCLALAAVAFAASAQSPQRPVPPGSKALEEPPPPPRIEGDPALEPRVTIRREGESEIQEYRVRGKLYMMRVTPKNGRPYILVDHRGDGQFKQQDTLTPNVAVPQWVLLEF